MSIIQEALKKAQDLKADGTSKTRGALDAAKSPTPDSIIREERISVNISSDTAKSGTDKNSRTIVYIVMISIFFCSVAYIYWAGIAKHSRGVAISRLLGKGSIVPSAENGKPVVETPVKESSAQIVLPIGNSSEKPFEPPANNSKLQLNGIMFLDGGPRAIINNSIVLEGDTIGSSQVIKIERRSVLIRENGAEIKLDLK